MAAGPGVKAALGDCTRPLAKGWGMESPVTKGTPRLGAVMQVARPSVIGEKNKQKYWIRTTNLGEEGHVYRWRAVHFIVTSRKVVQHRIET